LCTSTVGVYVEGCLLSTFKSEPICSELDADYAKNELRKYQFIEFVPFFPGHEIESFHVSFQAIAAIRV